MGPFQLCLYLQSAPLTIIWWRYHIRWLFYKETMNKEIHKIVLVNTDYKKKSNFLKGSLKYWVKLIRKTAREITDKSHSVNCTWLLICENVDISNILFSLDSEKSLKLKCLTISTFFKQRRPERRQEFTNLLPDRVGEKKVKRQMWKIWDNSETHQNFRNVMLGFYLLS